MQAKLLFPNTTLIVGVCGDADTHRLKGKTVMNEEERAESVRQCVWADEVIVRAPWIITKEFLAELRIDAVTHDAAPYADLSGQSSNAQDCYQMVKEMGIFIPTVRSPQLGMARARFALCIHPFRCSCASVLAALFLRRLRFFPRVRRFCGCAGAHGRHFHIGSYQSSDRSIRRIRSS
jgi:cytidyltransferase-like protein